ncbi:hypothetical protein Hanom_Chr10g00940981 [Helianthus anomalus]
MRHMEQFVGSRRNFFRGFSVHGARKKAQCNYLRKRYAAVILLSPMNKYGDEIRRRLDFVLDNYFCQDVDIYVVKWVNWTNTSWLRKFTSFL